MIIKQSSYSMQATMRVLDPSLVWLDTNVGDYVTKFIMSPPSAVVSTKEPDEEQAEWATLLDAYHSLTGTEDVPFRIRWHKGTGWHIFHIIHYEAYDKDYMRSIYHLYFVIDDDTMAVQFKLAVL